MQTVDPTHEHRQGHTDDDIPPPPIPYMAYVERELNARVRSAYERGRVHGARHQLSVFLAGIALGSLASYALTR